MVEFQNDPAFAADPESGYVRIMMLHLPVSFTRLDGCCVAAAYMSTIGTQLNWGASYLVNDVYKTLCEEVRSRRTLCESLTGDDDHLDDLLRNRVLLHGVNCKRVEIPDGSWSRDWSCVYSQVVLVADKRMERGFRYALGIRDLVGAGIRLQPEE